MANEKTSELFELDATPADDDLYNIVDISDTTMASSGTNKRIKASRIVHQTGGTASLNALGLGTATPSFKLHISASGQSARFTSPSSSGDCWISFSQLATLRAAYGYEDTNDVIYLSSYYGDVVFRAASTAGANSPTEYVRIKSGGNVGIGTATPTAKLDVAGTVQMDALRLDQTPTSGAVTLTHYINVNLNGTNYRIPCGTA